LWALFFVEFVSYKKVLILGLEPTMYRKDTCTEGCSLVGVGYCCTGYLVVPRYQ